MNSSYRAGLVAATLLLALPAGAMDTFVYFGSHSARPGTGFSLAHFDTDIGGLAQQGEPISVPTPFGVRFLPVR